MLALRNVSISGGGKTIISGFSHSFKKGKVYAIMGPNGSGKSTLAHGIMGDPAYQVRGSMVMRSRSRRIELVGMSPDSRSREGLFLSFQAPHALQGIRVSQLLQLSLGGTISALDLRKRIKQIGKDLHIDPDLLGRSLNDGASGGERKKIEVLQAAVLDKSIQIYDEIDTGVDIDALQHIGEYLHAQRMGKTYLVITHYTRLFRYLPPDEVIVLEDGKITRSGDIKLAHEIERTGYTPR